VVVGHHNSRRVLYCDGNLALQSLGILSPTQGDKGEIREVSVFTSGLWWIIILRGGLQ
jgi:hypothetical protein